MSDSGSTASLLVVLILGWAIAAPACGQQMPASPSSSPTVAVPMAPAQALPASDHAVMRDPDYSDGMPMLPGPALHMHGQSRHAMVLLDHLEHVDGDDGRGVFVDARAWYGGDINKLWLKLEGDYGHGRVESLRSEALWSHAVAAYWDTQGGRAPR